MPIFRSIVTVEIDAVDSIDANHTFMAWLDYGEYPDGLDITESSELMDVEPEIPDSPERYRPGDDA